jgi:uncharacterized membrane protein YdjX (TVP38/TMEM64 family)
VRRRYYIYHPIVTKLLVSVAVLGLLMIVVSSDNGTQALDGIHIALKDHILWAVLLLGVLFFVSTLSPFFPEFMVFPASSSGSPFGAIFAVAAIAVAASTNFWIARKDGHRVIELLFDRHSASEILWTATRITPLMVFFTWLLPSINFDLISYAAGLSKMRYRSFIGLTASGTVASAFLLAFLGDRLRSGNAITVVATVMGYTVIGIGLYAKELPPWFSGGDPAGDAGATGK